jgi:hypothetical protein
MQTTLPIDLPWVRPTLGVIQRQLSMGIPVYLIPNFLLLQPRRVLHLLQARPEVELKRL